MRYVIIGTDVANSLSQRQAVRPEHLARLAQLRDAGRLLMAGPFPAVDSEDPAAAGFTGSLIVAEFDSLAEAQAWAETDPYLQHGVYARVEVKPFKQVF